MKRSVALLAAACAATVLTASASAAPSMRDVLAAAYSVRDLSQVDLSPNGRFLAWRETFHDSANLVRPLPWNELHIRALDSGLTQMLTAGPRYVAAGAVNLFNREEDPVWSPDSREVAFLSDARTNKQLEVYVADADGSHVRQVGSLHGEVDGLTWMPDGTRLGVLYIPGAHRQAGALAPGMRDVGVIGTTVDEQRLATVDVRSGAVRLLTPADSYVYEYDWSPDGLAAAVTYAKGNGDNNWWVARLARVDVAGATMRDLLAPSYQITDPRWSPDGRTIAIVGGIMSDFSSSGGDVYLVDAQTGVARDATVAQPISVQSLRWNDSASLDIVAHSMGSMYLMRLDAASGTTQRLTDERESLWSWASAQRGTIVALVRASFDRAPEVWAGPPHALAQITTSNTGARHLYGKAESIEWSSDGSRVQGWLVYPLGFDPRRAYAMVTVVHGGPSAISVPSFGNRFTSALASQGYFVFMPNPRGSFGEGEAFTRANVKDLGYGDWRDDLAGVDAALKAAPIDPQRLGLFGWSYGGYIAMWAETQTTRFKALVSGAGVVNWQSYYGQNKIDEWMIPFFGASVYQDPAIYARSSPITFIEQSKTPILILQGELDEEVPAPQAFEFWHAMTTLGVPTKLIVYAGEGHRPQKIADQIDVLTQTVAWFDRYLRMPAQSVGAR